MSGLKARKGWSLGPQFFHLGGKSAQADSPSRHLVITNYQIMIDLIEQHSPSLATSNFPPNALESKRLFVVYNKNKDSTFLVSMMPDNIETTTSDMGTMTDDIETMPGDIKTMTSDMGTMTDDIEMMPGDIETTTGDKETIPGDKETMPAENEFTWDVKRVVWGDKAGIWVHKLSEEVGTLYDRGDVHPSTGVVKDEGVAKEMFESLAFLGSFTGDEAKATWVGEEAIMKVQLGLAWTLPALWVDQVYCKLRDTLMWKGHANEAMGIDPWAGATERAPSA
ncbi:unnamed protein product [Clonostachys solani]|uniref:Uncharacterized protein n=1 Tax=Clonostachys solani TaxID=160281 RepID=A0A9N9WBS5_9HYPO|nr:unnamed protein product [Clonostachys solani]